MRCITYYGTVSDLNAIFEYNFEIFCIVLSLRALQWEASTLEINLKSDQQFSAGIPLLLYLRQ